MLIKEKLNTKIDSVVGFQQIGMGTIMDSFWVKIIIFAVLVAGLAILIKFFSGKELLKESESSGFSETVARDKKKFLTEPKQVAHPIQEPVQEQQPVAVKETSAESVKRPVEHVQPTEPRQLYFMPLSEIDSIAAERLLNVAVPGRSIGRLPQTGFKLMVDTCREIIQNWPKSWYAYRAHQMLADMPERFRRRYHIRPDELDVSRFAEHREGTKLYDMKEPH